MLRGCFDIHITRHRQLSRYGKILMLQAAEL